MSETQNIASSSAQERSFGLLFGALCLIGAGRYALRDLVPMAVMTLLLAVLFLITALVSPRNLRSLTRAWMKLGELLNKIVSPIVLGAIYFLVFTPLALARRLAGHDALRRKYAPALASYWVERTSPPPHPDSFKDQF